MYIPATGRQGLGSTQITMQFRHQPCRRPVAGSPPDTAGQLTRVRLQVTLGRLRDLPGAEWSLAAPRGAADGTRGWVTSPAAAEAYACDAGLWARSGPDTARATALPCAASSW
jgi:hypothetical protein